MFMITRHQHNDTVPGGDKKKKLVHQDAPSLLLINADEAAINKSTSADQLQEVHDHQAPAQPDQLPDASFQLLDVDQIYLTHHNGGASIINAKKIGPDAKKKMVDGKEVIKLCDDGLHRVVWEVPMAGVDCEWQCL